MIEINNIGISGEHEKWLSERSLKRLDCSQLLKVLADYDAFTDLPWGEHCTECAAPDCHGSCDLFVRGAAGRCVRFADGITAIKEGSGGLYTYESIVKPWGQFIAVGHRFMEYCDSKFCRADAEIKAGYYWLKLQKFFRFLPDKMQWFVTDKLRGLGNRRSRRLNRKAERKGQDLPDELLCVIGSPSKNSFKCEISISGFADSQAGRSVRRVIDIGGDWSVCRIPIKRISGMIDLDGLYRVSIVPLIKQPEFIQVGYCGFVKRRESAKVKLLICDLDNTLWKGTLIEDGEEGVKLFEKTLYTLNELDRRGILLSIASKNNEEDALSLLEKIGIRHLFLHPRINWQSKGVNISEIVAELNIGMDSVAFIDDQIFEREEVKSVNPAIRVFSAEELELLPDRNEFKGAMTDDASRRRSMYQEEQVRSKDAADSSENYFEFLKRTNLKVCLNGVSAQNRSRIYELVQRTNQLNYSGTHYSSEQIEHLLSAEGVDGLVVSCSDKYGDYGIIGFVMIRAEDEAVVIEDMMFSCRIMGKTVDAGVLRHLAARAAAAGVDKLECKYTQTKRNGPAKDVLIKAGFDECDGVWVMNTSESAKIETAVTIEDNNRLKDMF